MMGNFYGWLHEVGDGCEKEKTIANCLMNLRMNIENFNCLCLYAVNSSLSSEQSI